MGSGLENIDSRVCFKPGSLKDGSSLFWCQISLGFPVLDLRAGHPLKGCAAIPQLEGELLCRGLE